MARQKAAGRQQAPRFAEFVPVQPAPKPEKRKGFVKAGLKWAHSYEADTGVGVGQAAAIAGIDSATLKEWTAAGYIPSYFRAGRRVFNTRQMSDLGIMVRSVRQYVGEIAWQAATAEERWRAVYAALTDAGLTVDSDATNTGD